MKPIIKWPGGKSREIEQIRALIPTHRRYIEPFFGGGALFFHLTPENAAINDASSLLMSFYRLIGRQDERMQALLYAYADCFRALLVVCEERAGLMMRAFDRVRTGRMTKTDLSLSLHSPVHEIVQALPQDALRALLPEPLTLEYWLHEAELDRILRTVRNDTRQPFSPEDLRENLITGFAAGFYLAFRSVYNELSPGRSPERDEAYRAANFWFIRETCYGSMFRYNKKGEFNVPYGGMTYNRKDLRGKIDEMFREPVRQLFENTDIHCGDFEAFLSEIKPDKHDFLFLDPPYDTDFSAYEGRAFTKDDQARLARVLRETEAPFLLVIKNTDFIRELYEKDFSIFSFDKQYTCNYRSRNDRDAEHLIITNLPY